MGALRPDAGIDCKPRRTGLPNHASAGVECRPGLRYVDRVGAYYFANTDDMLAAYSGRMSEYGVRTNGGNCLGGTSSETGWGPSFAPDDPDMPWARAGCYLDENNIANVRLTCDEHTYVGILGTNSDLRALFSWAFFADGGYVPPGMPPGICVVGGEVY